MVCGYPTLCVYCYTNAMQLVTVRLQCTAIDCPQLLDLGLDVLTYPWRYRGSSPTAVQAWQPCPLWEPSPSHPILL